MTQRPSDGATVYTTFDDFIKLLNIQILYWSSPGTSSPSSFLRSSFYSIAAMKIILTPCIAAGCSIPRLTQLQMSNYIINVIGILPSFHDCSSLFLNFLDNWFVRLATLLNLASFFLVLSSSDWSGYFLLFFMIPI